VLRVCFLFGFSWAHGFPLLAIFEFFLGFAYTGFHPLAVLLTPKENPNMAQNRKTALLGLTNMETFFIEYKYARN